MKADSKRLPGFYWVRFEGEVIVAEWTDGKGCEGSGGHKHWHVPGSEGCFKNGEVCELLSGKLFIWQPDSSDRFGSGPKQGRWPGVSATDGWD